MAINDEPSGDITGDASLALTAPPGPSHDWKISLQNKVIASEQDSVLPRARGPYDLLRYLDLADRSVLSHRRKSRHRSCYRGSMSR